MVKGISRRVVVVDSPDQRFFEQAIFIVLERCLAGEGVTARELVEEARRWRETMPAETMGGSAGSGGIFPRRSTP